MRNNTRICYPYFIMKLCRRILFTIVCFLPAHSMSAQDSINALDMMLQRPKVDKRFETKRFLDRIFLESGVGFNTVPTMNKKVGHPSPNFEISVGDWQTPVHGWRIGLQAGRYKYGEKNNTSFSVSADYLMNITALSVPTFKNPTYNQPKPFELYGVAGLSLYSPVRDNAGTAIGAHIGLRGQANFSNATYAYLEGRAGIFSDDLVGVDSWRRYRFGGTLMAGLGYRLVPGRNSAEYVTDKHFLSDAFVAFAAGPAFFLKSDPSQWSDYMGVRTSAYIGKWFNGTSGIRLGAHATALQQPYHPALRALSLSAGYMWNMHNTFMGYNPERCFWLNAVADASLNASSSKAGKSITPGIGAGLQANFRLTKGVDFFLEPRVDVFKEEYATFMNTMSGYDITPSLMAGLALRQGRDTRSQLLRNDDFANTHPLDHVFIEGAFGGIVPVTAYNIKHPNANLRPKMFAGIGKWFTATSGMRLRTDIAQYQVHETKNRTKAVSIGADYLWNMTNAFHGYKPERRFELIGSLGANVSFRGGSSKIFLGGDAGIKGLWHVNEALGLFIEPRLQLYADNYIPHTSTSLLKMDLLASTQIGLQVRVSDYQPTEAREAFEASERKDFFSAAGGIYTSASGFRNGRSYGVTGRLSYGSWISPVSAWRLSIGGKGNPRAGYRYAQLMTSADYISDLTTLAWGYNDERIVNLRTIIGLDLGAEYRGGSKARFSSEVHIGGQLGLRISSTNELFLEPQLGYALNSKDRSRWQRITPSLMAGITHRINPVSQRKDNAAPANAEFISLGLGTGLHTSTVTSMSPVSRKFSFDTHIAYGRWLSASKGYRAALSHTVVQRHGKNQNITGVSADYMFSIFSTNGHTASQDTGFRLTGFIGANLNVGSRKGYRPTWAPGLQLSVQPSYMFNDNWSAHVEAQGILTTKNIIRNSSHPAAGQLRLMIGTAYHF